MSRLKISGDGSSADILRIRAEIKEKQRMINDYRYEVKIEEDIISKLRKRLIVELEKKCPYTSLRMKECSAHCDNCDCNDTIVRTDKEDAVCVMCDTPFTLHKSTCRNCDSDRRQEFLHYTISSGSDIWTRCGSCGTKKLKQSQ